jgi:hypothetical protein
MNAAAHCNLRRRVPVARDSARTLTFKFSADVGIALGRSFLRRLLKPATEAPPRKKRLGPLRAGPIWSML